MPSLIKKIGFSLIPAVLVWLLVEAGISVAFSDDLATWKDPEVSSDEHTPTLPGNPYLLYEYRPGEHLQAGATVTINQLGLRGAEPTMPKPAGIRRILTTGDSSVFGFGVTDPEVFSEVTAGVLGDGVEAINAATPGYSSYQTINLLRLRALQTEPDLIVIGNIWSDNNFDAFVDKELLAAYAGFEESFSGALQRLLSLSAIYRLLDYRLRVAPAEARMQEVGWLQSGSPSVLDSGEHIGLRRVEINDYAANLETLVDIADASGAEVAFLMLANNEDLDVSKSQGKAWDPYRQVMKDTAARHGAPLLDVPELFIESGMSREALFIDEMHPTPAGHRLMGEALARLLSEHQWPSQPLMGDGLGGAIPTYEDPYVSGGGPNDPSAQQNGTPPGGEPSGAPGPQPGSGARISGTLTFSDYSAGTIQIECVEATTAGGNPTVLGTDRLQGPGTFSLDARTAESVMLRVYLDENMDGPGPDDRRFQLKETIIQVADPGAGSLVVDLDAGTVTSGG
ncbi:MAG: SGNH/GDSL hydrolase family protein [Myxococcota bacterium]|nr:SGNH/GDSL hydrolase family protein [Myxococcota bacterium]